MSNQELKEERMKILELLSKGSISAEQAENLLNALGAKPENAPEPEVVVPKKKDQFRMLKIYVDSADGDVVRVQLPIEFAKLLNNKKFMKFDSNDIDLDVDMIIQMINTGAIGEIVNVKSADGDIVRVVVE